MRARMCTRTWTCEPGRERLRVCARRVRASAWARLSASVCVQLCACESVRAQACALRSVRAKCARARVCVQVWAFERVRTRVCTRACGHA
eukprot:6207651-Pleurochrysis_carterae.AAC.3